MKEGDPINMGLRVVKWGKGGGVLQQKPTFADLEYNFVDLL